ncbi:MAG: hypothetical protein ACYDA4_04700 [Ignavibacteriaceae bacterium]
MPVDLRKYDPTNLKGSESYLLSTIASEIIPDVADPDHEDYMKYAGALVRDVTFSGRTSNDVLQLFKKILKAIKKSEQKFNYSIYKGHILFHIALHTLTAKRDLDKTVSILKDALEQDRSFGYTYLEHRPSYKTLSFLEPILTFRNELWPSRKDLRDAVSNRLGMILPFSRAVSAIAMGPELLRGSIENLVDGNERLKNMLIENIDELIDVSQAAEKKNVFYKSTAFLIANIVEGILLHIATMSLNKRPVGKKSFIQKAFRLKNAEEMKFDFEKDSIQQLSRKLRQQHIIDEATEYFCRFIQHYRDFIHPARNLKQTYNLNVNFNKMFLMFFVLLLGDLEKAFKKQTFSNM